VGAGALVGNGVGTEPGLSQCRGRRGKHKKIKELIAGLEKKRTNEKLEKRANDNSAGGAALVGPYFLKAVLKGRSRDEAFRLMCSGFPASGSFVLITSMRKLSAARGRGGSPPEQKMLITGSA